MTVQTTAYWTDPETMSGTPVFAGTRVPIKNLFDYLRGGDPLDRFLDHFPSVSREQAIAVLGDAQALLIAEAPVRESAVVDAASA